MKLLVTGGCGFIGSNYIRHVLALHPQDEVVNLDALTYAGNPGNLANVEADYRERYRMVKGDIRDAALVGSLVEDAQAVVHFAAESHVDRSIEGAASFISTNVMGTQVLLEAARMAWQRDDSRRFLMVSTDEVYGSLELGDGRFFTEGLPLNPRSPYSASKAGADHLASAFHHTYGLDVVVTRCCNNYGPYQFPEKLIPLMILNAWKGMELPIYGDGLYVRDWIYVSDNCRATDLVLRRGRAGQVYNIGTRDQRSNLEVVERILDLVARETGKDREELRGLMRGVKDRPGHDRRYAIDPRRLEDELGFSGQVGFEEGLARTVCWYLSHAQWCESITSGSYRDYCRRMYDGR